MAKTKKKTKTVKLTSTDYVRGKGIHNKNKSVKAASSTDTFVRMKGAKGRDFMYTSAAELEKAWLEYFQWVVDNPWQKKEAVKSGDSAGMIIDTPCKAPFTIMGFQAYHGLGFNFISQLTSTLAEKEDKVSNDISCVIDWARAICHNDKFDGAMLGFYNANLTARDLELVDKRDVTTSQPIMAPTINVYSSAPPLAGSEDEIDNPKPKKK